MREDFTNGIYVFRYDFDCLDTMQIILGEGIVSFRNHSMRKPARSLRDYELGGHALSDLKLMGALLRKVASDGGLAPWEQLESRREAEDFISKLPGTDYNRLMRCKADFFEKANIADYESILQLTPLMGGLAESMQGGAQAGSQNSSGSSSETNGSTAGESSSEG